eukprot:g17281.t1
MYAPYQPIRPQILCDISFTAGIALAPTQESLNTLTAPPRLLHPDTDCEGTDPRMLRDTDCDDALPRMPHRDTYCEGTDPRVLHHDTDCEDTLPRLLQHDTYCEGTDSRMLHHDTDCEDTLPRLLQHDT